jgi:cell division protein FtsQ
VARGERSTAGSRPRARAESAVASIPRLRPGSRLDLHRVVPSGRSLALGLLLLTLGAVTWIAGRTTSLFAVDAIEVHGAGAGVAADVRGALATTEGRSLLQLDLAGLEARIEAIPTVADATLDRAFPHRLVVAVVPERPVAVLRQGANSWLASAGGRVVSPLARGARPALPRIWLGRSAAPRPGARLSGDPAAAIVAVAPLAGLSLPVRVASVRATRSELTLVLRSGLEIRLGDGSQLPLKLAVAARILPRLPLGDGYLDVAVPERPVAAETLNSQLQGETSTSTSG